MANIEITKKWMLEHDGISVIGIAYFDYANVGQSETGNKTYFYADTEDEIQAEIDRLGLLPKWETDLEWQHATKYRFKVEANNGVIDSNLRALMDYAEANNVLFQQYANYLVFYVDYFFQPHYDLFQAKGIVVEMADGVTEIDIRTV